MKNDRSWLILLVIPLVAALTLALPFQADAGKGLPNRQFWLRCDYTHSAPDDPILYPGQPGASHLHSFFGNRTTDANSSYDSMLAAPTVCRYQLDTAAYWFPALLRPDGTEVPPGYINAYYWGTPATEAFPAGFTEVAHPPMGPHAYYTCIGSAVEQLTLPSCGNHQARAVVEFPDCWDGATTNGLVYSFQNACPAGYPVHIPRLVLHETWNTNDASADHLSSDAQFGTGPGGSLHADFWNTWNQAALAKLVQRCYVDRGSPCKNLQG